MILHFQVALRGKYTLMLAGTGWILAYALQTLGWDEPVFRAMNTLGQWQPWLWASLSVVGLGLVVFMLISCSHVWLLYRATPAIQERSWYLMGALLWALVLGGAATYGLKSWFATARPPAVLTDIWIIGQPLMSRSMPSGHAITAFTLAGLLWGVLGGAEPNSMRQRMGVVVLAVAIGLSRIATAAHWPSDVLAGMGVGLCVAWLALYANQRYRTYRVIRRRAVQWVWAAVLLGASVAMWLDDTGYPMAWAVQWGTALLGLLASAVWFYQLSVRCNAKV